jgi:prepilin-type N-terminal cleavage/methylation domain-containing protein
MDHCPTLLKKKLRGMSIIELLIVVVVLSILMTVMLMAFKPLTQLAKARDAERKGDLQKLKNPLEDYYNDHKCYPPAEAMDCKLPVSNPGSGLMPYWSKVPCDPDTNEKYYYEFIDCNTYRIYTRLENLSDVDIAEVGCSSRCGPGLAYNYGVSSSNIGLEAPSVATCDPDKWRACGSKGCHVVDSTFPGPKCCNDCSCLNNCQ